MASRFWVGGTGTWDGTSTAHWAATSGGAAGASVPTAADDVFFDANSGGGTVTTSTTRPCNNFVTTGFTGSFALASAITPSGTTITLGAGTSWSGAANITFVGTGTCTLTSNGRTLPNLSVTATGAGKLVLADAASVTAAITVNSGTFDTNGQTVTAGSFSSSNTATRTLTFGSSSITLTGTASNTWNTGTTTGLTITANTATVTFTGSSNLTLFAGGAFNMNGLSLVFTGGGSPVLTIGTIANLTITGTASKTGTVTLSRSPIITGTLTVNGNSATNRVVFASDTPGTARTVTAAAVVASNVDLADITAAGAASWNLSAIAGGSGDLGGNSGITFTAPATSYWVGGSGNQSDVNHYASTSGGIGGTGRVSLPQDTLRIDVNSLTAGSRTITADMPRFGSIDFTGSTNGPQYVASLAQSGYGSLNLTDVLSFSLSGAFTLRGRGTNTIRLAGKTLNQNLTIDAVTGSYTLADAFATAGAISLTSGTLDTANQSVTAPSGVNSSVTNTRTLTLGTSTVTFGAVWNFAVTTGLTFTGANATLVLTASTSTRNFAGGGLTYGTLSYTVADSPGTLVIIGSNTIGTLNVGPGRSLQITAGTTQTVTTWNVNGDQRGYVYLPGAAGAYVSSPDSAALSVTGDLDVRCKVALNDWTPAATTTFLAKWQTGTTRAYRLGISTAGILFLAISTDGTNQPLASATVATGIADGAVKWIRATRVAATGIVSFYLSDDGVAWTPLGANVAGTAGAIADTTAQVELGSQDGNSNNLLAGRIYVAEIYNGIAGALVGSFDASKKDPTADTYTGPSGNVWTLNGQARQGDGRVTVESSVAASSATVSIPGTTHSKYLTLQDITGAGAGIKNARRSRIASNVTGWNVALSAKLYRSGGTFRVKPHRTRIAGTMTEKKDLARTAGTFGP